MRTSPSVTTEINRNCCIAAKFTLPPHLVAIRGADLHCKKNGIMKTAKITTFAAAMAAALLIAASPASARQCGGASWYALNSTTASGERMNPAAMTAAHKKLPFGAKVRVTNRRNGRSVVVRINDRGPFIRGRIVDLSKAAAAKIGMVRAGHANVCLQRIG